MSKNRVLEWRKKLLMSRSELARRSGLSVVTITRIENGKPCRMDTMKKILQGLGLSVEDKNKVFLED
ncbi:MAG: helix-turn-helix transcriptional regulator [Proteobacteria bacterium]|jgi:transcriptional regulator with XRE-family HTH domain|nr:helix-turn-helix transcriptional regulator [Pseudomonadota bacterium]